jgi:O-antigen/teichoic acid export membrane protein
MGSRDNHADAKAGSSLERLIKTLRRPAIVSAIAVMNLRVLTLGSRFFLSLLLARMLPAAELGLYGLLTAGLAFALFVVGLEYYSYTLRQLVAADPPQRVFIISNQIVLAVVMVTVTAVTGLGLIWFGMVPAHLAPWFILILITEHFSLEGTRILIILSRAVRAYLGLFLRGGLWVVIVFLIMLAEPSTRNLETVLFWWALGGISCVILTGLSLTHLPWRVIRQYRPDWRAIWAGLRVARPFMLTALSALTLSYFDRFIIEAYLGREVLGVYTFYSTVAIGILSLGASISHQFLPKVIAGYAKGAVEFRRVLRVYALSLSGVGVAVVVACAIAVWPALMLLHLDTFSLGLPAFYIMLVGVLIRILADVPSYALYAAHADKVLLGCNLAAAAVSILVNVLLISRLGLVGAALANVAASLTLLLTLGYFAWSRHQAVPKTE